MSRLVFTFLVSAAFLSACGSDDSDNNNKPDAMMGPGPYESKVVGCYGDCPNNECDEGNDVNCDKYDDSEYNVTNQQTICAGADQDYCVLISKRDDGQYEFGEYNYWHVDCTGAPEAKICVRNGCGVGSGCN